MAKTSFLRLALILALGCPAMSAYAATRYWTGGGALVGGVYQLWSDADNWDPHGAPQDGDYLILDSDALFFDPSSMFNDLTNLTVPLVSFHMLGVVELDWSLYGNTIILSNPTNAASVEFHSDDTLHIHCGLRLESDAQVTIVNDLKPTEGEMHLDGPIDLNGHNLHLAAYVYPFGEQGNATSKLYASGPISGSGNVNAFASEGCYLELAGPGNSFSGRLFAGYSPGVIQSG